MSTTDKGNVISLLGHLTALEIDLSSAQDAQGSKCIDEFVDVEYSTLKALAWDILVVNGQLHVPAVFRIETYGWKVVFEQQTGRLSLYLKNGHFTVKE